SVGLMLVVPAVALASSSRVAALDVPGDYIKDYTGIFTYVSGVNSVGNLVYAEPNNGGVVPNEAMGAVLGNLWEGRLGTWGFPMRRFAPTLGQSMAGNPLATTGLLGAVDPNVNGEAFDLMWGHKMGNGNLGLRLNRSFISREVPAGTAEGNGNNGRNIWGVGGGIGFALNPNMDVELAGEFQNRSFKGTNINTPSTAEDNGGSTYMIAGRAWAKGGGNLMWVPVAKFYSIDLSSVNAATPAVSTDSKLSGWEVGGAGNWSIGSDDLLILGLQIVGNKLETTVTGNPTQNDNETFNR